MRENSDLWLEYKIKAGRAFVRKKHDFKKLLVVIFEFSHFTALLIHIEKLLRHVENYTAPQTDGSTCL